MDKNPNKSPHFSTEDQEAKFWLSNDVYDFFDPSQAIKLTFPNLKPTNNKKKILLLKT